MRGLVYIGRVVDTIPILNADRLEAVEVVCGVGGKWRGVVQKGQFTLGDTCQVYLQDSLLPQIPEFAFMEKYRWRIRMAKLRGMPSEVLVMPQTLTGDIGADVTDLAGVTKYEKPLPLGIGGDMVGPFPACIPKTDEPNFQCVPRMVQALQGVETYATVKIDGSSGTAFREDGKIRVCSRNWELRDNEKNVFWACANQYFSKLPDGFAVQFEAAGPGIQGNPAGFTTIIPLVFQVYFIPERQYLDMQEFFSFCEYGNIPTVERIAAPSPALFANDDLLRAYAEGTYPNGKPREGVVIRPVIEQQMPSGERVSFKVINLDYKER